MKRTYDAQRLLRWYPPSWRERYGDEFLAYLEDRVDESPLTFRTRSSIAIAGVRERSYGSGMVGTRSTPERQRRTGSLMVMVAWSIMIVGGAGLAKMAEHYQGGLAQPDRAFASVAYNTTAVAGAVGSLLVFAGGLVALPGFVRFVRAHGWPLVRRTLLGPVLATAALLAATIGLAAWAHHLSSAQRNGADAVYSGAFVAFALVVVVTIALWSRAGVVVATKIDFTSRELRWESLLAYGVCLSALSVVTGATAWWIQVGRYAPWLLNGGVNGVSASPWSVRMVATTSVMALALAIALWGAARIATSYRTPQLQAE